MINPKTFPTIMMILSLFSAITYAVDDIHNWRMILYWLAAATINFVITW